LLFLIGDDGSIRHGADVTTNDLKIKTGVSGRAWGQFRPLLRCQISFAPLKFKVVGFGAIPRALC
jgi:hypothetical protein